MLIDIIEEKEEKTCSKYIKQPLSYPYIEVSHRFGILKKILSLSPGIIVFQPDKKKKEGYR